MQYDNKRLDKEIESKDNHDRMFKEKQLSLDVFYPQLSSVDRYPTQHFYKNIQIYYYSSNLLIPLDIHLQYPVYHQIYISSIQYTIRYTSPVFSIPLNIHLLYPVYHQIYISSIQYTIRYTSPVFSIPFLQKKLFQLKISILHN